MTDPNYPAIIARLEAFRDQFDGVMERDGEPLIDESSGLTVNDVNAAIGAMKAMRDAVPIQVIDDLNDLAKRS